MNKLQLIDVVANKMNISKREAADTVDCVFGVIKECLKQDEDINIGGFGAFKMKTRSARIGVNPKTGEKINIAESKLPTFRASKALKDTIK